ncbi:MAG: response regulator [Deltaproteobacteria bacterium]
MPNILTVDDSSTIRSIISKTLGELGFTTEPAEDGQQGLAKLAESSFELILLDVTMPVMDGPTMLEKLRASGNKTPVIMLTSESKRSIMTGAIKLGVEDYILKPFKPEELKAKVLKTLRMEGGSTPKPSSADAQMAQMAAASPAPTVVPAPTSQRPQVDLLLVDDMENVHKKFRSLLPETLTMKACASSRDALQLAQEAVYRVIVIDLVIPDVNSQALMNQLRILQPQAVMTALALRSTSDIAAETKAMGFQDCIQKPFDASVVEDWRAKYFAVVNLIAINDNVLSIAEFAGKQDKVDGYYAKLKTLCRGSFEQLASACYEDSIVDLSKVPMHNDKLPRLVMEMDSEAKKFGITLRLVGVPEAKRVLSQLVETASLPFFNTLAEAKVA